MELKTYKIEAKNKSNGVISVWYEGAISEAHALGKVRNPDHYSTIKATPTGDSWGRFSSHTQSRKWD